MNKFKEYLLELGFKKINNTAFTWENSYLHQYVEITVVYNPFGEHNVVTIITNIFNTKETKICKIDEAIKEIQIDLLYANSKIEELVSYNKKKEKNIGYIYDFLNEYNFNFLKEEGYYDLKCSNGQHLIIMLLPNDTIKYIYQKSKGKYKSFAKSIIDESELLHLKQLIQYHIDMIPFLNSWEVKKDSNQIKKNIIKKIKNKNSNIRYLVKKMFDIMDERYWVYIFTFIIYEQTINFYFSSTEGYMEGKKHELEKNLKLFKSDWNIDGDPDIFTNLSIRNKDLIELNKQEIKEFIQHLKNCIDISIINNIV